MNPFNGIERCFIVEFVDFVRVEVNPFNGIESSYTQYPA